MLTYMIPSIEPIAEYNPFLHRKPIVWFKSRLLSVLKMGSLGETVQSATTTPNYPPQSIVIKVARGYQNKTNNINEIGLVQIYFVGDFISNGYNGYGRSCPQLKRVLLWRSRDNKTNKIDSMSFSSSSYSACQSIAETSEMLTYINYIIKQLNTL